MARMDKDRFLKDTIQQTTALIATDGPDGHGWVFKKMSFYKHLF
ncbi:MAG: hypothetical protein ACHQFW_11315 [Chitinophagales bacterium]